MAFVLSVADHEAQRISVSRINNTRYSDRFAGATADARFAAAITDLPSTGGWIIDDSASTQTLSACPFTGVTKPVVMELGTAQYDLSVDCTVPASVKLVFQRGAKINIATTKTLTFNSVANIDAPVQQIFSWAGTGKVAFTNTGVGSSIVYPEWWGAKTDGTTPSLSAFQALSDALVAGMTVKLSEGIYELGALVGTTGFRIKKNNISFIGSGAGVSKIRAVTNPTGASGCISVPICVGIVIDGTSYVSGLTLKDFAFEDNPNQGILDGFGIPGVSAVVAYGVTNVLIQNVEFYNIGGNSPIQLSCGTQADLNNGRNVLIDHVLIHTDTSHKYFSGINYGSCNDLIVQNSTIKGKWTSGAIGGGEAQRTGDQRFLNNVIDATNAVQGGSLSCIGPGGSPNHSAYILNNTCIGFGSATTGAIFTGNETGGAATDNGFKYVYISGNYICCPGTGISLDHAYYIYYAQVTNNTIKAASAINLNQHTNSPTNGTRFLEIAQNVFDHGTARDVLNIGNSCTFFTDGFWSIHDNQIVGSTANNNKEIIHDWTVATCLKTRQVRIYNNNFQTLQTATVIGSHQWVQGLSSSVAAAGGTSTTSITYAGVLQGDNLKITGMGFGCVTPVPSYIEYRATVTSTDTVEMFVRNNHATNTWNANDNANIPCFIGERRY